VTTLFGATRQGVLQTLFLHPDQRFYQHQIIQKIGHGSGAVQRELRQLTSAGILSRTVEGHQTYYQANRGCPFYEELRGLIRKTFGVGQVLQAALQPIAPLVRLAFVYGSVAGGRETASSDIDLMLVGDGISLDAVIAALAGAQREIGREVNPTVYREEEFCRKLAAGHHFLSSVVRGPKIFLIGDETELTGLPQKRLGQSAPDKPSRNRRSVRRRRP